MLELVSLHSTSMSIIGSMVYFGHPVLLRTSSISYRQTVGNKVSGRGRSDTYKISSSRRSPLRRILNIIMSGFYSVLDEIYRNKLYYFRLTKRRLSYLNTHKLINLIN